MYDGKRAAEKLIQKYPGIPGLAAVVDTLSYVWYYILIQMNEEYHKHVIVGAGISAMQAGLIFAQNNEDFIIL